MGMRYMRWSWSIFFWSNCVKRQIDIKGVKKKVIIINKVKSLFSGILILFPPLTHSFIHTNQIPLIFPPIFPPPAFFLLLLLLLFSLFW